MTPLAALAPAWILFEILQLVAGERLLGLKQIQAGRDTRQTEPSQTVSAVWVSFILLYWAWMFAMFFAHVGRPQLLALLGVSLLGMTVRRVCTLRWVLVVLTFEGAIRIGMLVSLGVLLWRGAPG
ncbi:hypothetical protein DB347_02550 [Opitutaceae bacterium EW11]|nr:hypothetical protein DB347_02550 [Opitutaceae bacterium EW11]